ncbi:MAG: chromate transporter [Defluviitaleaceae bacterium]|nr:chromate transporter [Defluviitaleaceae bacterium]
MIYLQIFWVFFISNILGYGGGPSIVPLIQHEVVAVYGWFTAAEFAEIFAMGNALPGPIAPKIAAYIGFNQAGVLGAMVGVVATVAPSALLMVVLMGVLTRYKDSPQVKRLTRFIRPTIAVLMLDIALRSLVLGWEGVGVLHMFILAGASLFLLLKIKAHPGFVVLGALVYGVLFLG